VAAQRPQSFEPLRIAEKHEEDRRRADPRHVGKERGEPVAPGAVLEPDHRRLLEIRFGRGRERRREQEAHQRIGHRALA